MHYQTLGRCWQSDLLATLESCRQSLRLGLRRDECLLVNEKVKSADIPEDVDATYLQSEDRSCTMCRTRPRTSGTWHPRPPGCQHSYLMDEDLINEKIKS